MDEFNNIYEMRRKMIEGKYKRKSEAERITFAKITNEYKEEEIEYNKTLCNIKKERLQELALIEKQHITESAFFAVHHTFDRIRTLPYEIWWMIFELMNMTDLLVFVQTYWQARNLVNIWAKKQMKSNEQIIKLLDCPIARNGITFKDMLYENEHIPLRIALKIIFSHKAIINEMKIEDNITEIKIWRNIYIFKNNDNVDHYVGIHDATLIYCSILSVKLWCNKREYTTLADVENYWDLAKRSLLELIAFNRDKLTTKFRDLVCSGRLPIPTENESWNPLTHVQRLYIEAYNDIIH